MMAVLGAALVAVAVVGIALIVAGLRGAEEAASPVRRSNDARPLGWWRWAAAAILTVAVWWWSGWPVAGVGTAAMTLMVPRFTRAREERERTLQRAEDLASWSEMLRDTIATGAGLQRALAETAQVAPPTISSEVRVLAARTQTMPLADALRRFAAEVDDAAADLIVSALVIASEHQAGRLVDLLSDIANATRSQVAMRQDVEAGRARTYASTRTMVWINLAIVAVMVLFRPAFMDPYHSVTGQLVMAAVASLFVGAVHTLIKMSRPTPPPRVLSGVTA